jgi:hypothetical protein
MGELEVANQTAGSLLQRFQAPHVEPSAQQGREFIFVPERDRWDGLQAAIRSMCEIFCTTEFVNS